MRRQSNSCIMLQDAERGVVLDGKESRPAQYAMPSKEQLDNTKTLPEHKMKEVLAKVSRDSLPGTPLAEDP